MNVPLNIGIRPHSNLSAFLVSKKWYDTLLTVLIITMFDSTDCTVFQGTEPTSVGVGTINIAGGGTLPIIVMGTRTGFIHLYSDSLTLPQHEIVYREGQTGTTWASLYANRQAGHAIISDIG